MLIEFTVTNFRSFRDTQTFSMVAGNSAEHSDANTFDAGLPGFARLLRSSVVYGPNAAGKTNLLRSLQFMQGLVLNSATATAATAPPYTPFKFATATRDAPSEFQVTFVQNQVRYEYGFEIDANRIRSEWLVEFVHPRGREMFAREFDETTKKYRWKFSSFFKGQRSVWSETTRPNALFLSTAIQLNSTQLLPVFEWFQKRLVVIVGVTTLNAGLTLQLLRQPDGKKRFLPFLQEADLGIVDLDVSREPIPSNAMLLQPSPIIEHLPGEPTPNLVKITFKHLSDADEYDRLDLAEESSGTQVLFRSAGAWMNVLANGEVLLFDEIETSLHPILIRFLISRFHSGETNPHNAQIICSTHNTSLLDQTLFRRDQIWFVDKTPEGSTKLYPLTDFRPRNDEVLERWYMRGRYGALPVLDQIVQ
jgi:uncharacterized protein